MTYIRIPNTLDSASEILTELGVTSLADGQVLFGTGSSAIDSDSTLTWDNTNKKFVIKGKVSQAGNYFETRDSNDVLMAHIDKLGGFHLVERANSIMNVVPKCLYYNTTLNTPMWTTSGGFDRSFLYKDTDTWNAGDVMVCESNALITNGAYYSGTIRVNASSAIGPAFELGSFGILMTSNYNFTLDTMNDADGLLMYASNSTLKVKAFEEMIFMPLGTNSGGTDPLFFINAFSAAAGSEAVRIKTLASVALDYLTFTTDEDVVLSHFDEFAAWHPPTIADATALNNSIYYSSDSSRMAYKNSEGTTQLFTFDA